ncbi:MAG TPA: DegQ family serine endoprotease [Alphaproteobacteria bacterium]|nr:DegQ family serine endoprotease [Alphaproteobacteria bacterium]
MEHKTGRSAARRTIGGRPGAFLALGLIAALTMGGPVAGRAATDTRVATAAPENGFADLAERLLPAVVNVSTTQIIKPDRPSGDHEGGAGPGPESRRGGPGPDMPQFPPGSPFEEFFKQFFDKQGRGSPDSAPRRMQSLGSGFIIDPAGYIVTNNHVIDGADEIKVTLHDNRKFNAKLVGKDAKTDIALLKVDSPKPLPSVKFGNSDNARVGDWIVAIGNPFGLGGSVTVGIVSARARDINAGPYDDFIQTDASINRGNSGGPMFNLAGEVIGINTAIYSPTGGSIGIGFAVPSALARNVVDQIRKYGHTRRGWLGVNIQTVTDDIAESLGLDKAKGALVARVTDRGPAAEAKIQPGDVILKFDGRDVTDMKRLPRMVAETPVGKTVEVDVWRKDKEIPLKVKLQELEENEQVASAPKNETPDKPAPVPEATVSALGMSLAQLTAETRERFDVPERTKGVLITKVNDGTSAAERDLRAGDVIVEVAQEEVSAPDQVVKKINQAKSAGRKSVLVMVERRGEQRFVGLPIDGSNAAGPSPAAPKPPGPAGK